MSTNSPQPPARRWPWLIGGMLAVAALIVAILLVRTSTAEQTAPVATSSATPAGPSPAETLSLTPDPVADAAPTGCLGGPGRDAAMVLSTVEKAPHTSNGAVEVAASLVRWISQYPVASAEEVAVVQNLAVASDSAIVLSDGMASTANLSGGAVADGAPFYVSTAPGVWDLTSAVSETVTVVVGTGLVEDGVLSSTQRQSVSMTMQWENDGWKLLASSGSPSVSSLFTTGTAFTGGC